MTFDKEILIQKLLPLVQEAGSLHCFGSRGYMNIETGEMTINCNCAGDDEEKHFENGRKLLSLETRMCEIIEEETGIPVFVFPGTYADYYFCKKEGATRISGETLLSLNEGGEIKEARSYA